MQATSINFGVNGFPLQNRSSSRVLSNKKTATSSMMMIGTGTDSIFGLRLRSGIGVSAGAGSVIRSSVKSRSVKAQASGLCFA